MHTPGPWRATKPWSVDDSRGRVIASVHLRWYASPDAARRDSKNGPIEADEAAANARLIAAAPELLEALKELHDLICGECPGLLEGDYRDDMARAAIAKATGGAE